MSDDDFEKIVQQIQNQAFDDARNAYGEKGFERWRNPKYGGVLEDADCSASITGGCGDTMTIYLKFTNERVSAASYVTDGCASSGLCGSFTAELALNRTAEQCFELSGADVLETIGVFPEAERHCADLSSQTLHEAVNNYLIDRSKRIR
ncbi:MAG: iron-sulfur cluster assembly scaffold protein [Desulfobulbaceae bacterium]|nr:MAG: iron-sulfur cluster assembly scaffold protein [Desulfobulbaceae bacterium]